MLSMSCTRKWIMHSSPLLLSLMRLWCFQRWTWWRCCRCRRHRRHRRFVKKQTAAANGSWWHHRIIQYRCFREQLWRGCHFLLGGLYCVNTCQLIARFFVSLATSVAAVSSLFSLGMGLFVKFFFIFLRVMVIVYCLHHSPWWYQHTYHNADDFGVLICVL